MGRDLTRKRLFDVPLAVPEGTVLSVAFNPEGTILAAGYALGGVRRGGGGVVLWDVTTETSGRWQSRRPRRQRRGRGLPFRQRSDGATGPGSRILEASGRADREPQPHPG